MTGSERSIKMETKNYAVVFPYQKLLDEVFSIIQEGQDTLYDWEFDIFDKIIYSATTNIYFLREGYGDAEQFENIMWYTPGADTPDKVIEWIKEIFYGKQA